MNNPVASKEKNKVSASLKNAIPYNCLFWAEFVELVVFIYVFSVKTQNISDHFYSFLLCLVRGHPVCVKIGLCLSGRLRYSQAFSDICNFPAESSATVDSHIVWTPVLMPQGQAKNEAAERWQLSSSESARLEWVFGQC